MANLKGRLILRFASANCSSGSSRRKASDDGMSKGGQGGSASSSSYSPSSPSSAMSMTSSFSNFDMFSIEMLPAFGSLKSSVLKLLVENCRKIKENDGKSDGRFFP